MWQRRRARGNKMATDPRYRALPSSRGFGLRACRPVRSCPTSLGRIGPAWRASGSRVPRVGYSLRTRRRCSARPPAMRADRLGNGREKPSASVGRASCERPARQLRLSRRGRGLRARRTQRGGRRAARQPPSVAERHHRYTAHGQPVPVERGRDAVTPDVPVSGRPVPRETESQTSRVSRLCLGSPGCAPPRSHGSPRRAARNLPEGPVSSGSRGVVRAPSRRARQWPVNQSSIKRRAIEIPPGRVGRSSTENHCASTSSASSITISPAACSAVNPSISECGNGHGWLAQ